MSFFRETGRISAGLVSSGIGSDSPELDPGLIVLSSFSDKSIVIRDLLVTSGSGSLGTGNNGSGTLILYYVSGSTNLTSPIKVPKGESVYASGTANITITYNFED